ncbi:glycosyltransferase [Parasphingopyxis lamellibrachiae]|uniref:Glycosyltransferase involved in cell wall biosynthesis n=1 Tax=Parasphingopyxis lamellibrachiae TaxID=680125 RepID=A0A3D9FE11_9SPHN|nr:glycosyltransferase [Parasphingopyxis lamellibrachiae]RED16029.1 glycosyltransferase involved in cell wall biosynthesis [Parasphingopyxis lamellibrachiae]
MLALTTEKRLLEYRVINAHRTLAHGLGRALIEARSLKGLLALPGRIRRLSMKQRAKRRERVPNSFTDDVASILRLVDPAFERAAAQGLDAAIDWVRAEKAEPAAKARALAELAHATLDDAPEKAARIGEDAARKYPGEQRLFALAVRLREKGLVLAPASLCAAICGRQPLSPPQIRLCDLMMEDAALLERGRWGESPAHGPGNTGEGGLVIICPPRWAALPRVLKAREDARKAGATVSIVAPADKPDFAAFSAVHIFANSIGMACAMVVDAHAAGCRIILDIANPPASMLRSSGSEREAVDGIRLKGLAAHADILIARSMALGTRLGALDIDCLVAGDAGDAADAADDEMMTAALAEYGVRPVSRTVGCFATLDEDAGSVLCLEAFAALAATGEAGQLLIFGKGSRSAHLSSKAEALGLTDQVNFVGMPPPQRWPSLLAALDLAVFPRIAEEALGSEIPMLSVQALARGLPVLASQSAWDAQAAFIAEPGAVLAAGGDQAVQMRDAFRHPPGPVQPVSGDDPLADLYELFIRPL